MIFGGIWSNPEKTKITNGETNATIRTETNYAKEWMAVERDNKHAKGDCGAKERKLRKDAEEGQSAAFLHVHTGYYPAVSVCIPSDVWLDTGIQELQIQSRFLRQ